MPSSLRTNRAWFNPATRSASFRRVGMSFRAIGRAYDVDYKVAIKADAWARRVQSEPDHA